MRNQADSLATALCQVNRRSNCGGEIWAKGANSPLELSRVSCMAWTVLGLYTSEPKHTVCDLFVKSSKVSYLASLHSDSKENVSKD
jgi:hypothetical protein